MKWRIASTLAQLAYVLVGSLLIIVVIMVIRFDPLNFTSPTDEYLITLLNDHREQFETLRQQYSASSNKSVSVNDRVIHDQKASAKIPSLLGVGGDVNGITRFIFAEGNILNVGSGWAKGLEYVPDSNVENATSKDSLDQAYHLPPGIYVRKIDVHWFIFYQRDD